MADVASRAGRSGEGPTWLSVAQATARRWEGVIVTAILAAAATVYAWDLDQQGWANAYYSAAAQAGAHSWWAAFFGSLEVGNAVSTDKPPAALWLMDLSVRLFDLSSWSVVLPQIVESVGTLFVLHRTVRLLSGRRAALVATLVLATTPVFLVLARFNDPDTLLTLLVTCAAYCTVRATRSEHSGWLVGTGALLGLAFLTKWMVAFLPAPAMALVLLRSGTRGRSHQLRRLGLVAVTTAVAGLWWVVAVLSTPAGARPYADSSGGSVINLIVGQNGFSRLGTGGGSGADPVSGAPGPLRLLTQPFSGQIGWLLPLALCALLVPTLISRRPSLPTGYLLFGGWLIATTTVFSLMSGPMHPYYTSLAAPAVAALVGMSAADLWGARRLREGLLVALAGAAYSAHVAYSYRLVPPWPTLLILGAALPAALLLIRGAVPPGRSGQLFLAAATAGLGVSLLTGPTVFGLATLQRPVTGANPLAGTGRAPAVTPYPAALVTFLRDHHRGETWLAAVPTATPASRLQLQSGGAVLPLGGFTGHTPTPTVGAIRTWVAHDKLRYVVLAGPYANDPEGTPAGLRGSPVADVVAWARNHGCQRPVAGTSFTVVDLRQRPCPGPAANVTGARQRG